MKDVEKCDLAGGFLCFFLGRARKKGKRKKFRLCSFLCLPKETNQRKGTRHLTVLRIPSTAYENGRDVAALSHFHTCLGNCSMRCSTSCIHAVVGSQLNGEKELSSAHGWAEAKGMAAFCGCINQIFFVWLSSLVALNLRI
jgi:hypothetical protein